MSRVRTIVAGPPAPAGTAPRTGRTAETIGTRSPGLDIVSRVPRCSGPSTRRATASSSSNSAAAFSNWPRCRRTIARFPIDFRVSSCSGPSTRRRISRARSNWTCALREETQRRVSVADGPADFGLHLGMALEIALDRGRGLVQHLFHGHLLAAGILVRCGLGEHAILEEVLDRLGDGRLGQGPPGRLRRPAFGLQRAVAFDEGLGLGTGRPDRLPGAGRGPEQEHGREPRGGRQQRRFLLANFLSR